MKEYFNINKNVKELQDRKSVKREKKKFQRNKMKLLHREKHGFMNALIKSDFKSKRFIFFYF